MRLCDHPEIFAEIFGGSEYPLQAIRKLMAAVALVEVKDYFTCPERVRNPSVRARIAKNKAEADRYLFDPNYQPASRAFSFSTVCQFLGVDPEFARRGIRERTTGEIRDIIQRMTFHRSMDDV